MGYIGTESNQRFPCPAMFTHVHQRFLDDSHQFPTNPLRHVRLFDFGNKASPDSGLALEALDGIFEEAKKIR